WGHLAAWVWPPHWADGFVSLGGRAQCRLGEVDLPIGGEELATLLLHSGQRRLRLGAAVGVADVLGDAHRAELRSAHRAEVRGLRRFRRQRLIVEVLGSLRVEAERELVAPAEFEASLRQGIIAGRRTGMSLDRKSTR